MSSLVPERWSLIAKGTDPESGLPMALVAREKDYNVDKKLTIWKLVQRSNGWYSVAQWVSKGYWRVFPETNGVKLSDSVIDRTLAKLANS